MGIHCPSCGCKSCRCEPYPPKPKTPMQQIRSLKAEKTRLQESITRIDAQLDELRAELDD